VDRLKITRGIIEAETIFGGADLPCAQYKLNKSHPLQEFFPLHHAERRAKLKKKAQDAGWRLALNPPVDQFRE
jgi:hypothetical protein